MLVERALAEYQRNGRTPPAHVQRALGQLAAEVPAVVAALCPRLAALPGTGARLVSDSGGTSVGAAAPQSRDWLTVRQAAAQLGISERGVRKRCQRGQLAASKHPHTGAWRIDPAGIDHERSSE
jgi:Helix-turn-helix domain